MPRDYSQIEVEEENQCQGCFDPGCGTTQEPRVHIRCNSMNKLINAVFWLHDKNIQWRIETVLQGGWLIVFEVPLGYDSSELTTKDFENEIFCKQYMGF